jgi:capping protein alpha
LANGIRNGRYRAIYNIPVSSPTTISGTIHVHVHYYEDGNVALSTTKRISIAIPSISPAETVIRRIATAERDYQEELNRAFSRMAEDAFKSLRRQLPITRQKIEWEKVGGYRLGQDISGGKGR